jgi:hypothetical protein
VNRTAQMARASLQERDFTDARSMRLGRAAANCRRISALHDGSIGPSAAARETRRSHRSDHQTSSPGPTGPPLPRILPSAATPRRCPFERWLRAPRRHAEAECVSIYAAIALRPQLVAESYKLFQPDHLGTRPTPVY